ncbi:MAG TPA: PEP-CTERM sorting domain-containing protein, partial [Lacipirellulaceae bacterium]
SVWDTLPPANKEGRFFTDRTGTAFAGDPLVMILAKAGTATADGTGRIDVSIDDFPDGGGGRRTWLDGVAYVDAGTPVSLVTTIDRATGALTITNPTSTSFQIKGYSIESTSASLDSGGWTTIAGWTTTTMPNPATEFSTQLSQIDPAETGITIAANGGSVSFGNIWQRTPFENVLVRLMRSDNELAVIAPEFTGTPIANGDLDANGAVDLADFQTLLSNLHSTPGLPTRVQNYRAGDITGDGPVNFNDWAIFRASFNAENGEGSFEAMLAQIPEPTSIALVLVAAGGALVCARRRIAGSGLAVLTCLILAGPASAVTLLKVDVNSRAGEPATPAPPGDNTVPGFSPYTMQTGTTGPLGTSTGTVNGYTITLTAVNEAGSPMGVFDDRDRATPTTAPTLNQLYDDFIFAHGAGTTSTGEGGGLDVAIDSGGALMPNTEYAVSIYAFDTGSTGTIRMANWLDGNNANVQVLTTAFLGAFSPPADDEYRFDGLFRSDASGNLLLRARETTVDTHGVFLNGIEIADELPTPPAKLTLEVNTTTGAVSIANAQSVPVEMSYYELRSTAGSLNLGNWSSLDDGESDDPLGDGWDEAPLSSANILSEVNLRSAMSLAQGESADLGNVFNIGGAQDLQLLYSSPTSGLRLANISYVTGPDVLPGDFNEDGKVDAADYVVWRKTNGSQESYNLWRTNFGRTSGSGTSLGAAAAAPEPSSALLGAFGMVLLITALLRKPARLTSDRNSVQ